MGITQVEAHELQCLVSQYARNAHSSVERIRIVFLLAKRDDTLSSYDGRATVTCPLRIPSVCRNLVWIGHAHIDHKVPQSTGGLTVPSNLQATCRPCSAAKGDS